MKKFVLTLAIISMMMLLSFLKGYGEEISIKTVYNAGTGDSGLDTALRNLNLSTNSKNLNEFISRLSTSHNLSPARIESLIYGDKMTPADVYMAAGLAKIINKPLNTVVNEYRKNRGKGWRVTAEELGVRPGSNGFYTLKNVQYLKDDAEGDAI